MYEITISETTANQSLREICFQINCKKNIKIALEECLIAVDGKIIPLSKIAYIQTEVGQKISIIPLALGG